MPTFFSALVHNTIGKKSRILRSDLLFFVRLEAKWRSCGPGGISNSVDASSTRLTGRSFYLIAKEEGRKEFSRSTLCRPSPSVARSPSFSILFRGNLSEEVESSAARKNLGRINPVNLRNRINRARRERIVPLALIRDSIKIVTTPLRIPDLEI